MITLIIRNILILSVLLLSGCQATTGHYLGALADAENIIPIVSVPAENQRWQDLYLTIDSKLEWQQQGSVLTGEISYSQHPQIMYSGTTRVTLWFFLLDENNRVVSYRTIPGIFPGSIDETSRFSVPLRYNEHSVAYTFGYEVTFNVSDESGGGYTGWNLPRTGGFIKGSQR